MATKNNLDVGGEAPHHTELSSRYKIEGGVYDLTQIIAAVKGEQSNDDWNARTVGDRLDALKAYLKDQKAENVEDDAGGEQQDAPEGDGVNHTDLFEKAEVEELMASAGVMSDKLEAVRTAFGVEFEDNLVEAIGALTQKMTEAEQRAVAAEQDASQLRGEVQRLRSASTRDKPLHGAVDELKAPY